MINFQCLRCGQCCQKLIGHHLLSEALTSLALFPEETRYFANNIISPYRGKGIHPEDKNFSIYMYQLNTEPCPHIEKLKTSKSCKIYKHRPLVCRCYPFTPLANNESGKPITQADPACTSLKEIKDKNTRIEIPILEWVSCMSFLNRFEKLSLDETYWIFDLKEKTWFIDILPN